MQFSSIEEARATFAFGKLTFRCLACGKRHRWTGYDDISQAVSDCHHKTRLRTQVHETMFMTHNIWSAYLPERVDFPGFRVPSPSFWVPAVYPEFKEARDNLRDLSGDIIKANMPKSIIDKVYNLPSWFGKDKQDAYAAIARHREDLLPDTDDFAFLALTPAAAVETVRKNVNMVHRRTIEAWSQAIDLFDLEQLSVAYRTFVDKYCSRILPPYDMWIVNRTFTGKLDVNIPTYTISSSDFARAVSYCAHIAYTWYGDVRWPVPSRHVYNSYLLHCSPEGACIVGRQRDEFVEVSYTNDYVHWTHNTAKVSHFPLSAINEQVASYRAR